MGVTGPPFKRRQGYHSLSPSLPSIPLHFLPSPLPLSSSLPSSPLPPSLPPSPPLEVGPLNAAGGLWERCELPQWEPKSNLVHFSLKIWQLVATILMILLTVNWPNFVRFSIQLDVVSSGLS